MAHEQSETVEIDGRWFNVYGRKTKRAGQPLKPIHDFERESYDTVQDAVAAAKKRSKLSNETDDSVSDRLRGTILTPKRR